MRLIAFLSFRIVPLLIFFGPFVYYNWTSSSMNYLSFYIYIQQSFTPKWQRWWVTWCLNLLNQHRLVFAVFTRKGNYSVPCFVPLIFFWDTMYIFVVVNCWAIRSFLSLMIYERIPLLICSLLSSYSLRWITQFSSPYIFLTIVCVMWICMGSYYFFFAWISWYLDHKVVILYSSPCTHFFFINASLSNFCFFFFSTPLRCWTELITLLPRMFLISFSCFPEHARYMCFLLIFFLLFIIISLRKHDLIFEFSTPMKNWSIYPSVTCSVFSPTTTFLSRRILPNSFNMTFSSFLV